MLNDEMNTGTRIRDIEQGVYKVLRSKGKILHFPSPVVEVSPAAVVTLEDQLTAPVKPFDIHEVMGFLFAPMPSWLKDGE